MTREEYRRTLAKILKAVDQAGGNPRAARIVELRRRALDLPPPRWEIRPNVLSVGQATQTSTSLPGAVARSSTGFTRSVARDCETSRYDLTGATQTSIFST